MGWNSYDYYDTTVNEEQVKANADYMAAHLKDCGWEYVVVDIQWYAKDAGSMRDRYQYIPFGHMEMDEYGRYQPAVNRFPSSEGGKGFGPLAEYVHSLGLKFGIHIMRGIPRLAAHLQLPLPGSSLTAAQAADAGSICGWNPDMYGVQDNEAGRIYYDSLIQMYADWAWISSNATISATAGCTVMTASAAGMRPECCMRPLKSAAETLCSAFLRALLILTGHGSMRNMPTCGGLRTIFGTAGTCF